MTENYAHTMRWHHVMLEGDLASHITSFPKQDIVMN